MRRPAPVEIEQFVHALDNQLRWAVPGRRRLGLPGVIRRLLATLRSVLEPILLGGALAFTSVAVIVAVGVAPATMRQPAGAEVPLAAPITQWEETSPPAQPAGRFAFELLAASDRPDRRPDNQDMPRIRLE